MSSSYSHFSAKNIKILYIESAQTVNEMTLNELVKLTTLGTTGSSSFGQYNRTYLNTSNCQLEKVVEALRLYPDVCRVIQVLCLC